MKASRTLSIGLAAVVGLSVGFGANRADADFYSAAADFSATANPNGVWSYGWSGTLGSPFIADAIHQPVIGVDFWEGSIPSGSTPGSYPYIAHNGSGSTINFLGSLSIAPGQLVFHPGPGGEYALVRFTAPSAGAFSLSSSFLGLDSFGTTTDVHVLVDGTSIFDGSVNGFASNPSFSKSIALQVGDTVDFAVGFGSNNNFFSDGTGLTATLSTSAVPEPGSLILLVTAGLSLGGYTLRRRRDRPHSSEGG